MALDEPCEPWPLSPSCCASWVLAEDSPAEEDEGFAAFQARLVAQERAQRWATAVLWKRSGRKFGVCASTLRVCPDQCRCLPCKCGPRALLMVSPNLPIVNVDSITNVCSGTVIDPERYAVIDDHAIGLIDRSCGWTFASNDEGVGFDCELEVVFTAGWEPDVEAIEAMSELACEYTKHCLGEDCRSEAFLKLAGIHKRGKRNVVLTGLPFVDHFLINQNEVGPSAMMDPSDAFGYSSVSG